MAKRNIITKTKRLAITRQRIDDKVKEEEARNTTIGDSLRVPGEEEFFENEESISQAAEPSYMRPQSIVRPLNHESTTRDLRDIITLARRYNSTITGITRTINEYIESYRSFEILMELTYTGDGLTEYIREQLILFSRPEIVFEGTIYAIQEVSSYTPTTNSFRTFEPRSIVHDPIFTMIARTGRHAIR